MVLRRSAVWSGEKEYSSLWEQKVSCGEMPVVHGKNLAKIKQQNLESIKMILYRYAPLSRAEIAEMLELTPPTITNIVSELIQQGVVQELETASSASSPRNVGRKPINIDLVEESRLALGISLGRDITHYCITDLRGNIYMQGTTEIMPEDYDDMICSLLKLIERIKGRCPEEWERLIGIGISTPGIVDAHNGILKNLRNERVNWQDRPMAEDISKAVGLPVRLDNNVRARACAVSLFHPDLLGDNTTFAYCHVYWGIACPIMLDNRSFRGEDAAAGEIGKMVLDPEMVMDPCSPNLPRLWMPGSLESLSSVRAVMTYCQEALEEGKCTILARICSDPKKLTLEQVLLAQKKGDQEVCKIIERAMFFLGIALANVVDFLNPNLIFLSGPMFANPQNLETVEQTLYNYAFCVSDKKVQLVYIDQGEYGGAIGAAACCIEKYFLRGQA